jgi:endonuclease I
MNYRYLFSISFLLFFFSKSWSQAVLPTFWNFSNPAIENPPTGWSTQLGTGNLTYSGSNFSVGGDNISCRLDGTGEFVMIQFAERAGEVSYWMRGTGIAPNPAFTGSFKIQESVNGTSWTDLREFTTANPLTSTMTRYVSQPSATARYVRFFYSTKESGTNVALDSVMLRQAPPCTCPVIAVKYNNVQQADGATVVTGTQATLNFLLENRGSVDMLTVDSVVFTGDAAQDFLVSQKPATINANSNGTLTIDFASGDNGSRIALMSIFTNDPEKNPFTLRLYAIGGTLASEPVMQPTGFQITNVKPYGMDISWQHPTTRSERYLVLRKSGLPVTENPMDGSTYQRGDYIGEAQVMYIGAENPVLKPTFIHANTNYHFKIVAFNGSQGFENYLTINAPTATVTTPGKVIGNYYSGINSASSNFVTSLSAKIAAHDTVFYSQYISRFVNPFITRDTTQARKVVTCAYTNLQYIYEEPFLWWTGNNSGTLTREHTYAQSWMPTRNQFSGWPTDANGRELTEYNDLHNLYPTHQTSANAVRSNLPFGEVVGTPTYTSPTGIGKKGLNASGVEVWEPADAHKGDVARALFYMCAAYNGLRGNTWTLPSNQDQAVLKKWHFQDLPDAWEIARHEFIASLQNNRNPFIDSVNFVCRINFSNMTWIATPPVNCGVTEPTLAISEPTATTEWNAQTIGHRIAWTSSGIDSLNIELYVNDTLNRLLKRVPANSGFYETEMSSLPLPVTNNAKIKLSATNGSLSVFSPQFTIRLWGGLNDGVDQNLYKIFPNPSRGKFSLNVAEPDNFYMLTILDVTGKIITQINNIALTQELSIAKPGVYFLQLHGRDYNFISKLMVIE